MKLALLYIMSVSITPFMASASTVNTELQSKVISALRAKRGYSDSVGLRILYIADSGTRVFLTAELTIKYGQ
jgi:hypothetical protein